MKITDILCLLFIAQSACASDLMIQKNEHGYKFYNDKMDITVPVYMASKSLRNCDVQKVQDVLNNGSHYLTLTECSDGSYAADLKARIKGGGPITAAALYWITKSTIYGGAVAATSAIAVTTAGTGIAAITGVTATAAGAGVASAAGTATLVGVSASTGAGLIGGGVAYAAAAGGVAAGAVEAAAMGTVGAVASAGGVAGAIAAVETAACGAFAFGMWLPLP